MPSNNKRIAKNALFLYFRMFLVSVVSLFTTRITLKVLGIEDFGIYNVVGGAVAFLGLFSGAMVSATQRFLSFELGAGNLKRYNQVFSMLMYIFIILSIIIFAIAICLENIIVSQFLVIPKSRIPTARWLYYFSVLTFIVNLVAIPYMSSIIAYEKMHIYAYVSLFEVGLKLVIVYLLYVSNFDKLFSYGFLTMLAMVLTTFFYRYYCIIKLEGCRFILYWEIQLFRKLVNYIGWNFFGSITSVLNVQGQSILLNIFFGPVVNAAKAIADRINSVVSSFSTNFYMAVRPQIVKSYAVGDDHNLLQLIFRASKFSYYLLYVIALPLIFSMHNILDLWLGESQTTEDMVIFSQLILVYSLVNVFEQPITVMIQATGDVKKYELIVGVCTLSFLPVGYVAFKSGFPAYSSLVILILIYSLVQFIRVLIAANKFNFSLKYYCQQVLLPVFLVTVSSTITSYYLEKFSTADIFGIFILSIQCFFIAMVFIFLIGISSEERIILVKYVKQKFKISINR